jgi:hypothetical protein
MSTWDGERFIFGDNNLTRPNRPVDTLLENVLRSQQIYLQRHRGNRVSHTRLRVADELTEYLGDKTYASLNRVNFFSRLMWICPNMKEISLFFIARVGSSAPGDPSVKVKVWIELEGFGIQEATWTKGARYQEYVLRFEFDETTTPPPRPVLVQMKLWMQSDKVADETGITAIGKNEAPGMLEFNGLYPPASFPGPNSSTLHEKYTQIGAVNATHDHLVYVEEDIAILYPAQFYGLAVAQTGWLSYLQIKGFCYEEQYTPTVPPQSEFRAGLPITGQHMLAHAQRLHEIHLRPRLLDLGHQGQRVDMAEVWHYHEEWQYIRSESGFPWRDVLRAPVILDEPAPRIELSMLAIPYQLLESYVQGSSSKKLIEDGAVAQWEVKIELVKYALSPIETVIATVTDTVGYTHRPTDISGLWPVLTQLRWREFGFDGPRHPTLKEGLLYEQDQFLVERATVALDASAVDVSDLGAPLSLRVQMRQAAPASFSVTEPDLGEDPQYLGVLLTGLSVWARHG